MVVFDILKNCINQSIETPNFPDCLKTANITPVFKKNDPLDKLNYRAVGILPLLSKVYEKLLYTQLYEFAENTSNSIICGFRKVHSTQHALFKLLQSWQKEIDNHGVVGTILMNLSKAYDCISHELLITKLHSYGVTKSSLKLILNYLSRRKPRTKNGSSVSTWYDIITGVPQGSILVPLLFNIFINDLFLFIKRSHVSDFADDNTLCSCNKNLSVIFEDLVYDLKKYFNSLSATPTKWSNTLKQFVGQLPTNCLRVLEHFANWRLKG